MGNHKFSPWDMIPNAWFYKLKDVGKKGRTQNINPSQKKKQLPTSSLSLSSQSSYSSSSSSLSSSRGPAIPPHPSKTEQTPPLHSHQRRSYYFRRDLIWRPPPPSQPQLSAHHDPTTFYIPNLPRKPKSSDTHFPEMPRKSSKHQRSTRRNRAAKSRRASPRRLLVTSSVSAGLSCRATIDSVWTKPDSTPKDCPDSPVDSSAASGPESLLPEYGSDRGLLTTADSFDAMLSWSISCNCGADKENIVDVNDKKLLLNRQSAFHEFVSFETIPELQVPPIVAKQISNSGSPSTNENKKEKKKDECYEITKLRRTSAKSEEKNALGSLSVKITKVEKIGEQRIGAVRRPSVSLPGVKLRTSSPG